MWKIKPPLDLPDLTNVTDLNSWLMPVDVSDEDIFADTGVFSSPIEGQEGDDLHQASYNVCAAQMPECAAEMDMLRLMYSQQIRSDCAAYENSLKQQRNASAQKLYTAEQALRDAALEQYQNANKYDLGQCVLEFKQCMIDTGECGDDFSGCATVAAFDAVKPTDNDLALCVTKEGIHFDSAVAKIKQVGKLGIALNMNGATLQLVEGFTAAKYLIIHNKSNKYAAFFVDGKGPRLISENEMTDMVTTKKGASIYLVYNADLNVIPALGELDFSPITKSGDSYSPHLLSIKSLIKRTD